MALSDNVKAALILYRQISEITDARPTPSSPKPQTPATPQITAAQPVGGTSGCPPLAALAETFSDGTGPLPLSVPNSS